MNGPRKALSFTLLFRWLVSRWSTPSTGILATGAAGRAIKPSSQETHKGELALPLAQQTAPGPVRSRRNSPAWRLMSLRVSNSGISPDVASQLQIEVPLQGEPASLFRFPRSGTIGCTPNHKYHKATSVINDKPYEFKGIR